MKKFIVFLLASLATAAATCLIIWIAAPAAAGAALLLKGVSLATNAVGIPPWFGVLLFISLLPTATFLAIKTFSPKFRRWSVIAFIILAVACMLGPVASKHKDDLALAVQSVLAPIEQWEVARHDGRLAELARQNESAKDTLQIQQQQLQMADTALRAERAARFREQQAFLDRLLKQLDDGQKGLTVAVAKTENPSLQSVIEANQRLAEASNALASAMTNGLSDLPSLQILVENAVSNSDKAQLEIQAAGASNETAKLAALDAAAAKSALEEKELQEAAQLKKLTDEHQSELASQNAATGKERQQDEADTSNDQCRQPDPTTCNQRVVNMNTQYHNRRYWMIDGRGWEFGPITAAQLKQWIAEGRANVNTPVFAEGWQGWQPLGSILPCPPPVTYYRQYYRQPSYYVRIWH